MKPAAGPGQTLLRLGQVPALGRVAGLGDRGLVGGPGLGGPAQPPEQVGADGVEQVVPAQVGRGQAVDQIEGHRRAVDLGHRDGAVECDHRAWRDREQLVVQPQDLVPVGVGSGRRVAVHRVDGRLDLVRAGLVTPQALPDDGLPLGDEHAVPACPVLVGEQHQRAVRGRPGGPPRLGQQHQREQPEHLRLVRHELGQQPPEPDRLGAQVGPRQRRTRTRRVALVEDQVDDGEHGRDPGGQIGLRRDAVRDPGVPDLGLGPDQPLGHGRFRHQERVRDLGRGEPAEQPERERDPRGGAERRVAAGEHEP